MTDEIPERFEFVRIGERRHPKDGEMYLYVRPNGRVYGPFIADAEDPVWISPPDDYIIYGKVE